MSRSVAFTCPKICKTQTEGLAQCVFAVSQPRDVAPGPEQVLVDVRAVGLNLPDLLLTVGKFTRVQQPPFVLGQEGSGVVVATGTGCKRLRIGDRVLFGARGGALCAGEPLMLREASAFQIPDSMPFPDAAAFNIGCNTAYNALVQRGKLQAGETLLVLGATGGTGLAAVQMAKSIGATVIAVGSTDAKLAVVQQRGGADFVVNSTRTLSFADAVRACTEGGRGVDVVFDPVGGAQLREAIRATRAPGSAGARLLILGFTAEYEADRSARNRLSTRLILTNSK